MCTAGQVCQTVESNRSSEFKWVKRIVSSLTLGSGGATTTPNESSLRKSGPTDSGPTQTANVRTTPSCWSGSAQALRIDIHSSNPQGTMTAVVQNNFRIDILNPSFFRIRSAVQ